MESLVIWFATAIIFTAIFVPYFVKFRRKQKFDLARKKEADGLGVIRPRSQHPQIDYGACIGCGSCVEACPEGDVLGVVFGKAAVINGDRCVGHGYCEQVCPVNGLKVGLGDIQTRDDIPLMDEYNQTTVPGIFIAGELGGISLIRNAVVQGKMVTNRIGDLLKDGEKAEYDLAIVGCGPAGLSAALSAQEKKISYVAFDQQDPGGTILQYPRRKLVMTQPVEIPLYGKLTNPEYSKEDLLDIWLSIISRFQLNIQPRAKIENIRGEDGTFSIPAGNKTVTARYVILAMGRRGTPRKLGVPGEHMSKVMYQLIDAQSYNDTNLLVVGGGDSAVEAAVGLARQPRNRVYLSYRKPKLFRIKKRNEQNITELIQRKEITPVFSSNVKEIKEKSVILEVEGEAREIPNDYVFVFAGGIPPFKMLKDMGIAFGGETKELL